MVMDWRGGEGEGRRDLAMLWRAFSLSGTLRMALRTWHTRHASHRSVALTQVSALRT